MRNSGWKPSSFDGRDLRFDPLLDTGPVPGKITLPHPFRPRDQGTIVPCCVSIAIATAMEILDRSRPQTALSALFHYYTARSAPGRLGLIDFRTGLQEAVMTGICKAQLHAPAFDEAGAMKRPSEPAYKDAERQRLAGFDPGTRRMQYEVVDDADIVNGCRRALASEFPVLIGFWLTSAYGALSSAGPVHGSPPEEPSSQGHAVVAVGYDDARGAVRIKDSRGDGFADRGAWWLPYDLLTTRLVHEAWVLRKLTQNEE